LEVNQIIILINFFLASLFWLSSHPIIFIGVIIRQTIIICILIWLTSKTRWFSFILFLIFLGGLIVLFIYITSLACNEKIYLNLNISIILLILSTSFSLYIYINQLKPITYFNEQKFLNEFIEIYSSQIFFIISLTIIYLLLTLVISIKLIYNYEGPLRNILYF